MCAGRRGLTPRVRAPRLSHRHEPVPRVAISCDRAGVGIRVRVIAAHRDARLRATRQRTPIRRHGCRERADRDTARWPVTFSGTSPLMPAFHAVGCATPGGPALTRSGAPRHLSTDHDPLFEAHRWTANLRILEIDEIKTVPHVPRSHPFVERLIGTTRRECLDHVLFWNTRDLERKLADFQAYYNEVRSHASLKGHTPLTFAGCHTVVRAELNNVRWISHCRDLVQLPVAA